jgi:hypothetical protein
MRKSKVVTKYVEKKAGATVSDYTVSEVDTGNPNLTVAVRIRPENDKEIGGKWRSIIKVLDEHVLVFDPGTFLLLTFTDVSLHPLTVLIKLKIEVRRPLT